MRPVGTAAFAGWGARTVESLRPMSGLACSHADFPAIPEKEYKLVSSIVSAFRHVTYLNTCAILSPS